MPDFSTAEYQARTRIAQAWMADAGLDAVFFSTEAEIRYFTGFRTLFWQSPTRPWYLVLPAAGDPIAVIPQIGAPLMRQTWVQDIRTWAAPASDDDGVGLLRDALAGVSRVGTPMGQETHQRMPMADFLNLSTNVEFMDCTAQVLRQRALKSDAEVGIISRICNIGCDAFAKVPQLAASGRSLQSIFRAFKIELLRAGAEDVPYLVGGAGPGGYSDVISPPSDVPLAKGDVLMLDTGASLSGYFCDFDRNFAVGRPSAQIVAAHHRLWDATEAGMTAATQGASCADVFRAMAELLGDAGDVGRMGHGLGSQLTEWPSLIDWENTPLQAGMVITLEPSMDLGQGRMMVAEENILITQGAPKLLTRRCPRDIVVI